jgi:NAD(P)-dependent dehydrogenase (short-subunit alcohol dehydrogenase family)
MSNKTVFILGIGSDIGKELAKLYLSKGDVCVIGTYRCKETVKDLIANKRIKLLKCDLLDKGDIKSAVLRFGRMRKKWDIFISCVGSLEPIGSYFKTEFNKWEDSFTVNAFGQLRFLHDIFKYRNKANISNVIFFAGGGTNNPLTNYSAYCASKILLIKMSELLDDENKDLNVFILGPGWVKTKILQQTLRNSKSAGLIYKKTVDFLRSTNPGTSYQEIFDCINWCVAQGKKVVGGRNISIVHDSWRKGGKKLRNQLLSDINKFKLRRFKNSA